MIYGQITNNSVVNIIELNDEQSSEFPDCVSSLGLPIAIGDTYDGLNFYRDGALITKSGPVLE